MRHIPVLLQEVLQGLKIQHTTDGESVHAGAHAHASNNPFVFIDCNLGDAGHTEAVIKTREGSVEVIGFDLDEDALARAKKNINDMVLTQSGIFNAAHMLHLYRKNFRTMKETLSKAGIYRGEAIADAILFDLGISSYEIDESGRGFSFQKDEPLSMTFGKAQGEDADHLFTAYDIVNTWDEENIADIIYAYGEDKYSRRIAKGIVETREALKKQSAHDSHSKTQAVDEIEKGTGGITTSLQLAEIVKKSYPSFARFGKMHPATRTFQALRIAVNDELRAIEDVLPQAVQLLKKGGRLAVISFHSLEDRIIKRFFKNLVEEGQALAVTKKPLTPTDEEVRSNPRSRSAKLRIVEKA